MNNEFVDKAAVSMIEAKATRYAELQDMVRRYEDEKSLIKKSVGDLMKSNNMYSYRVPLDENQDMKISVGESRKKKIATDELAEALGITEDAAKRKEVLIKAVEEGKLTLAQYKQYEFEDVVEKIDFRRVNAD